MHYSDGLLWFARLCLNIHRKVLKKKLKKKIRFHLCACVRDRSSYTGTGTSCTTMLLLFYVGVSDCLSTVDSKSKKPYFIPVVVSKNVSIRLRVYSIGTYYLPRTLYIISTATIYGHIARYGVRVGTHVVYIKFEYTFIYINTPHYVRYALRINNALPHVTARILFNANARRAIRFDKQDKSSSRRRRRRRRAWR